MLVRLVVSFCFSECAWGALGLFFFSLVFSFRDAFPSFSFLVFSFGLLCDDQDPGSDEFHEKRLVCGSPASSPSPVPPPSPPNARLGSSFGVRAKGLWIFGSKRPV